MTQWLPDVVPDQTIESAWGNTIRNRTITPFANAAARTAAIPAPIVGQTTYQEDTKTIETWNGSAWIVPGPHTVAIYQSMVANNSITNPATFQPLPATADRTALTLPFTKYSPNTKLVLSMMAGFAIDSGANAQLFNVGLRRDAAADRRYARGDRSRGRNVYVPTRREGVRRRSNQFSRVRRLHLLFGDRNLLTEAKR
jgi:hypothetical protein